MERAATLAKGLEEVRGEMYIVRFISFAVLGLGILSGQAQTPLSASDFKRPSYCEEPTDHSAKRKLPEVKTKPSVGYKIQVALLRNTDPTQFTFSSYLSARWEPCSEVWFIESKETYTSKAAAEQLQKNLRAMGYPNPALIKVVLYQ